MSGMHPSEEILQKFAGDRHGCQPDEIAHIEGCAECRAAVAAYAIVMQELEHLPAPAFDFNLAHMVIDRILAAEGKVVVKRKGSGAPMAAQIAAVVGLAVAFFWKSAYFVFTDMAANFYWVLLVVTAIVVGLFIVRLHRKYQQVINLINK
jgi:hypothetical protein